MTFVLLFFGTLALISFVLDGIAYWTAHRPEVDTVAEWREQMDALGELVR